MISAAFEVDLGLVALESARLRLLALLTYYHDSHVYSNFLTSLTCARLLSSTLSSLCDSLGRSPSDHDFHGVLVNGKKYRGLVDNGASSNIMSLAFASKNNIKFEAFQTLFVLADASTDLSIGRALVECAVPGQGSRTFKCEFHILASTSEPLILGRPFLYDTGLLKVPSSAAKDPSESDQMEASTKKLASARLRHCLRPHIRLQVQYKGKVTETLAVIDTGAAANIMSLRYARSLGYEMSERYRCPSVITLGNGRTVRSAGLIKALVHFPGTLETQQFQRKQFLIIESPPFDITIGNSFFRAMQVYRRFISDLEWIHENVPHFCPVTPNPKPSAPPPEDQTARKTRGVMLDADYNVQKADDDKQKARERKAEQDRGKQEIPDAKRKGGEKRSEKERQKKERQEQELKKSDQKEPYKLFRYISNTIKRANLRAPLEVGNQVGRGTADDGKGKQLPVPSDVQKRNRRDLANVKKPTHPPVPLNVQEQDGRGPAVDESAMHPPVSLNTEAQTTRSTGNDGKKTSRLVPLNTTAQGTRGVTTSNRANGPQLMIEPGESSNKSGAYKSTRQERTDEQRIEMSGAVHSCRGQ